MEPTSAVVNERHSDGAADPVPWTEAEARLAAAEVASAVTVRPDGPRHATPVVEDGKVFFQTGTGEVKYANIRDNAHVLVLAGDTSWDRGLGIRSRGIVVPQSPRRVAAPDRAVTATARSAAGSSASRTAPFTPQITSDRPRSTK